MGGLLLACHYWAYAGYIKSKQPAVIAPLVPLSFLFGYQADMALGNKMERILGTDVCERELG